MTHIKHGKSIKHINDNLEKKINHLLKAEELSLTQSILIRMLDEEDGKELPIKEIEKRFGLAQPTIFGVVSRMEKKGFVSSYWTNHNTRIIKLTELALSKVDFIDKNMVEIYVNELFNGFSAEEIEIFTELLLRVEENIK